MKLKELLEKQLEARKGDLEKLNANLANAQDAEIRSKLESARAGIEQEIKEIAQSLNESQEDEMNLRKVGEVDIEVRETNIDDVHATMEYRKAFKDFMTRGVMNDVMKRDNTTKADVPVVIPTNLVDMIIEKFEQLGVVYNLVTKTAFAVGQSIAIDGVKPVATWVAEGATSDKQKKEITGNIVFANYKLRCEISYSEEVSVMSISAFETLFVKQVSEAMLRAQEGAIVSGEGNASPKGILTETVKDGQTVELTKGESITYEDLCNMEASLPVNKEANARWCMTKKTFMSIIGITDSNGQPIARVNYGLNGKPERYILGREVVIYEAQADSKLKTFALDVASGSVVAFIFDFGDYILNTNYNLGVQSKQDWDSENHLTKAVLACDGKVIDNDSLVVMKVV